MKILRPFSLFVSSLLFMLTLQAQSFDNQECFKKMIREGETNLNNKRFFEALECFDLAEKCYDLLPSDKEAVIERWRQTTKQRINALVRAEELKRREAQQAALVAKNLVATFKTNNSGIRRLATDKALQLSTNGGEQEAYVKEIYAQIHQSPINELDYPEFTMVLDSTAQVNSAISEDGKKLAIVSDKNAVYIWNLETGIPEEWMTKFSAPVLGVSFIPQTPYLIMNIYRKGTIVLDLDKRKIFKTFPDLYFYHYEFAPSRNEFFYINKKDETSSKVVYIYNANQFTLRDSFKINSAIRTMHLSPDESTLAITTQDTLFILDAQSHKVLLHKKLPEMDLPMPGEFSPNGRYFAQAYYGNSPLDIFDLQDSLKSYPIRVPISKVSSFTFHPNSKDILTINRTSESHSSSVSLWHFPVKDSITYSWRKNTVVLFAEFDESGKHLMLQGDNNDIEIFRFYTVNNHYFNTERIKVFKEDARIRKVVMPPSKDFIITITENKIINKWKVNEENLTIPVDAYCFSEDAAIKSDGSLAVTIESNRKTLKCWNTEADKLLTSFEFPQEVDELTIFKDLLVLSAKNELFFYSLPEFKLIKSLTFEKPINNLQAGTDQLAVVSNLGRTLSLLDPNYVRKELQLTAEQLLNYPVELHFNASETYLMIKHLQQFWIVQISGLKLKKEVRFPPSSTFSFAFAHQQALFAYALDQSIKVFSLSNFQQKHQFSSKKNCIQIDFESDDQGILFIDENRELFQLDFFRKEPTLIHKKGCDNFFFTKDLAALVIVNQNNYTQLAGQGELFLLDPGNYLRQSYYKVLGELHPYILRAKQSNMSVVNLRYYNERVSFLDIDNLYTIPDYNLPALEYYGIYFPAERWLEVNDDAKVAKYYAKYLETQLDNNLNYRRSENRGIYMNIIKKLKDIAQD